MERNTTSKPHISVIIPAYNEQGGINDTIRHIRHVAGGIPVEIIVADGGPDHATLAALDDDGVVSVQSPPGRGVQMNAGAAVATGRNLLFLHADTRLPDKGLDRIAYALAGDVAAGAFSLSIDSPRPSLRMVAWFANVRSRLERVPYGDQAQFIKADAFRSLGGFAPIPIMEDVELFRRLRREGMNIVILPEKVVTSSRRWDNEGVLRRTVKNWWLRIRYFLGASPQALVREYRPHDFEADDR